MPRLSREASREIKSRFSGWLRDAISRLEITPGEIVYRSRMIGIEIPHSNLSRLLEGRAAPTPQTVVDLVNTLGAISDDAPSTPDAFSFSHMGALIRLIAGLSDMEDDELRKWPREPEKRRHLWEESIELQKRIAARGARAFGAKSLDGVEAWVDELSKHPLLLAVVLSYSYFSNLRPAVRLRSVLSVRNQVREQLYADALARFSLAPKKPKKIREYELAAAEQIANNWLLLPGTRARAISAILHAWTWNIGCMTLALDTPLEAWTADTEGPPDPQETRILNTRIHRS